MSKNNMNDTSNNFLETKTSETKPRVNSQTHWERLDALSDEDTDISDIPPLTDEDFARSEWRLPSTFKSGHSGKAAPVTVEIAVDEDILSWFQAQGQDYPAKMRAALRLYAEVHLASALSISK